MTPEREAATATRSIIDLFQQIDTETAPSMQRDLEHIRLSSSRTMRKRKPYITFLLGASELAIDIDSVQEIGELPVITRLPNLPQWIPGITQIRGEVLSAVDLTLLFDLPSIQQYRLKKSYIIFIYQEFKCCLVVDRITGVIRIDKEHESFEQISLTNNSPLNTLSDLLQGFIRAEQREIHFLDTQKLASTPRLRQWR